MRILLWHVHGGYSDSLVQLDHDVLFFAADDADATDLARNQSRWPPNARYVSAAGLREDPPDVVVIQNLPEVQIYRSAVGRTPGRDLPAVFLEHNMPGSDVPNSRHPLADDSDWLIVQVTHVNNLLWDCGRTPTVVVEHGIVDPGLRYSGRLRRQAFVVNEPVRRWRVTGTDLLPRFTSAPVDAFGIDADRLETAEGERSSQVRFAGNLDPEALMTALAERRLYLHLNRWTSLGLSLLQAMQLGMPVIVLNTTEASRAVPPEAGALSANVGELARAAARLLDDPVEAARRGRVAREAALQRYGLQRFLTDWNSVLADTCERWRHRRQPGLAGRAGRVRRGGSTS